MKRFSWRNVLGWIGGAAALVVGFGLQLNFFDWHVLAVIGVALVVLAGYWAFHLAEQWRQVRGLKEFALEHGWSFTAAGGISVAGLTGFPFGEGAERTVEDVIQGTYQGVECAEFSYNFEHHVAGEHTAPQVFTVTQAILPVPFPRLDLIPEDAGSRVLGAVTGNDIDLESAEFNRTWKVVCADKRFAVDVIDPRMMLVLLRHRVPGVVIRIDGDRVLAWGAGRSHTKDLTRRLDLVAGISKAIPAHVVRKYSEAEQQRRAIEDERERNAPTWATTGGVLNSCHYTGIGVDSDGDGVDDYTERNR